MDRLTDRIRPEALLAVATLLSVPLNMWLGRDLTFTTDELAWFMLSPDLDLSGAFHPYVGHLILTSKLLYKVIFELVGPHYWLIQLLASLVLVGVIWILFLLLRRFSGAWPALGISVVVLFFGGDPAHVFHGNGITVVGSVGCGLFALLMLSEANRTRSVLACLALCLGVATYSQALPFLIGVTVFLLCQKRVRDLWVPAIPFLLYFAWWVWARDFPSASQSELAPERIIQLPVWGFRATGALMENVVRMPDSFGQEAQTVIGLVIAAAMLGLLVWLIRDGRTNPLFFAGVAILLTMWALVIVVPVEDRDFDSPRYMYPFLFATVLVWGSMLMVKGRHRALAWAAGALVAFCCLASVKHLVNYTDQQRRGITVTMRAGLAGIEEVMPTDPTLNADSIATQQEDFFLNLPFRAVDDLDIPSVAAYTEAVKRYGSIGYTPAQLQEQGPRAQRIAKRTAHRVSGQ